MVAESEMVLYLLNTNEWLKSIGKQRNLKGWKSYLQVAQNRFEYISMTNLKIKEKLAKSSRTYFVFSL